MGTLYVSDLDGTLLRRNQQTSAYTNRVINQLVKQGLCFSYATARSYSTARLVTKGMVAAFPLIVYNGAFIRDNASGELLHTSAFEPCDAERIVRELDAGGVAPIVYEMIDGTERFSYLPDAINRQTAEFIALRQGDGRDRKVSTLEELLVGEVFYFTCIGEPQQLEPFFRRYRTTFHCVYQRDIYSGEQWLEIMPKTTSKAHAARRLKELLGCERVVAFGDGPNDIELFDVADESYAVANAVPELKCRATAVIGSNEDDGVAKWLAEHANPKGN